MPYCLGHVPRARLDPHIAPQGAVGPGRAPGAAGDAPPGGCSSCRAGLRPAAGGPSSSAASFPAPRRP